MYDIIEKIVMLKTELDQVMGEIADLKKTNASLEEKNKWNSQMHFSSMRLIQILESELRDVKAERDAAVHQKEDQEEVLQLKEEEVSNYKEMYEESKSKADSLKKELDTCKEHLLILRKEKDLQVNKLVKSRMASDKEPMATDGKDQVKKTGTKRKLAEDSNGSAAFAKEDGKGKKPLTAVMNTVLKYKLGLVFSIDLEHGCEHEENFLYDIFRQSIDSDDLERCFESMYKACHPEESFSLRDRKLLKEGLVRVCKGPFSACLKALGGVYKKRGTQTIWTNVAILKQ
jgi:hypothetical protein